jgi:hypothetical protein
VFYNKCGLNSVQQTLIKHGVRKTITIENNQYPSKIIMNYTEHQRLKAVDRFKNLDAGITKDMNELVDLVAEICQAPVALVTLLDADTQWFKAAKGTDVVCTPRGVSFCNNTIKQNDLVIIPDILADETIKPTRWQRAIRMFGSTQAHRLSPRMALP